MTRIAVAVLLIVAVLVAVAAGLDTRVGRAFVAERIGALRPADGMRYAVGRIDGSLYGRATLIDVRVADPRGTVLVVPRAELDWRPFAWVQNRLEIRSLVMPAATMLRVPQPRPTGRQGGVLPGFDIALDRLAVRRLVLEPGVTGARHEVAVDARADIRGGHAIAELAAVVAGTDRIAAAIDARPDDDRFDLRLAADGAAGGLIARAGGLREPVAARIAGAGSWTRWRGRAQADVGGVPAVRIALGNDAGRYVLRGFVVPGTVAGARVARLTGPRLAVEGRATLAARRLDGRVRLRSAALDVTGEGEVDLGAGAYRDLRIRARLTRPDALFANMTGDGVELRAILAGPFATARFDYRLNAVRAAFGATGFERVTAGGRGRLSAAPVTVPLTLSAARVTGVGEVAGGILNNLRVTGALAVDAGSIRGEGLRVASDRLNARISVTVDLATGNYDVALVGGLQRYLIPGLGIVDVTSRLNVVPGAGGARVVGEAAAAVVRLDNAFFASLTGGLPRLATRLERGADGVLYLRSLRLVSPRLTLAGDGYRRVDGSFVFEGTGVSADYGALTIALDGWISRPALTLRFARPNAAMGLRDVRARLEPTADGYDMTAAGDSRLGPFAATGAVLLPPGGGARIRFDRLDVAGTRASGALDIVRGGFAGRLDVSGGGVSGTLAFAPEGGVQGIDANLDVRGATLPGDVAVRRARVEATVRLEAGGPRVEATVSARGLRRGGLSLARAAVTLRLAEGRGEARAALAGSGGRGFAVDTVIGIAPDRYTLAARGTIAGRPVSLSTPAVIVRDGDAWRIERAVLDYAGGTAGVSGRVAADGAAVEVALARLPLSVLEIGVPGLGLGGSVTGNVRYAEAGGAAPTGRADLTIRGLTRANLVGASRPIDLGLAAVLDARRLGVRAVMAAGGQTVGRGQMLLTPAPAGDLATRLANAPMLAQLRYAGPADTLWRLTGVELFDLSGPVAIGADVRGRLGDPRITGSISTTAARIESATTGTLLRAVAARGRFDGSRLVIDRFTAQDRGAGRVSGSGTFDLSAARGFALDVNVEAAGAELIARDDIAATVTGPLRFRSDGAGGTISGQVRVDRGRYRLGRAAQAAAVPRVAVREVNVPGGDDDEDAAPPAPWRLDMRARIADGFVVQGLGLDSIWSGDLTIAGEPTNPQIAGRLNLVRGDYEFAGRRFDIERGIIRFDGSVPANPALDIAANAGATGLNATIRVTGTAERPEIGFSSTPALPEDELLSRLLFGTSITSLSAPEALQLAAAVSALQGGGTGLNPINAVRRAAGLDRLRILPADPQTGANTAIAAGKFLTRRVYAEIVSDGGGYSATRVEFQVTRWLSLLSSISTIGRQSANVRVARDY